NWTLSYSEYDDDLEPFFTKNVGEEFCPLRKRLMGLLAEETKLMEIVKLIGSDVLPDSQKLTIEIAKIVRTGFLQQNAYHAEDTYVPMEKQLLMMKIIMYVYDKSAALVNEGVTISRIAQTGIFEKITKIKYDIPNEKLEMFKDYFKDVDTIAQKLLSEKI
ncbi:MAG: V-type ATP synthase subunit A, partial [Oscillospiraceae bacterium]